MSRILSWFSCGTASAVATKLVIQECSQTHEVLPVCCDTRPSEHSDNYRFSKECETWFGRPIVYLRNEKYKNVDEVFESTRYMSGVAGARCTTELKKAPRLAFQQPDDIHVFGLTFDEKDRIAEFTSRNPELFLKWILLERKLTKNDCYEEITRAGIELPIMNQLGFDNNNCPGCVKASGPWYWSMIRKHFPEVFKRRCEQSRAIGCRLVQISNHKRIFLDELPLRNFRKPKKRENLSCGPECGIQTNMHFYAKKAVV